MVYAKKKKDKPRGKDTRRELRRPDEFISVTDRVVNAIVGQWKPIGIVVGIAALVFGVLAAIDGFRSAREDSAAALLYDAEMKLPEPAGYDFMTGMSTGADEGQVDEIREAVTHFDAVIEQYDGTVQADIANLEAGNAWYLAADYEQAEQRYAAAAGSRSSLVKALALNAQAQALESLEQFDREAEVLRQVVEQTEGATMEYAYLDLIRAHELQGDSEGALAVCREFEQTLPDSPLLDDVQNKIRGLGEEPAEIERSEEGTEGETT